MFVQLKSGFNTDLGESWIGWVEFTRTWRTARFHGRELARWQCPDGNFQDLQTGDAFWISGPKRDLTDARYGPYQPTIDDDARDVYQAFLDGRPLPGREQG